MALPHIFYSVIDSRTLVRKKAASGYYLIAPTGQGITLGIAVGGKIEGSVQVIVLPLDEYLGIIQ